MSTAAVLLDLDGTLVDTAPDMVAALNQVLVEEGQRRVPYALARNEVSNGALGLLRVGFGDRLDSAANDRLRNRFLQIYSDNLTNKSRIFSGFEDVFDFISRQSMSWGVVTNKPGWLTEPLLSTLQLAGAAGCIISGDSVAQRKPHPAPLQRAAELLGVAAEHCMYVGDAVRDIDAGRAAGMTTVAASYGYIPPRQNPASWGADFLIRRPQDLLQAIAVAAQEHAGRG